MTGKQFLTTTLVPLLLIGICPILVVVIWYACVAYHGSLTDLVADGALLRIAEFWPRPTWEAVTIVAVFAAVQAAFLLLLPGRTALGPVTPAGQRVPYRDNGFLAWLATLLLFYLGAYHWQWFAPTIVYDQFGPILTVCSIGSLVLCGLLYLKGIWFPSGPDAGRSGNPIFDYFWGVELHPRLAGFDLKQFANCRFGMMSWSVIILSFAAKQHELFGRVGNPMLVVVALQLVYVGKFFRWERGYLSSLDVMHDRFGFYLCWGVTTWLPCIYTSQALYLVQRPDGLSWFVAAGLVGLGLLAIAVNYEADVQRQKLRESGGKCTIWRRPAEYIVARYRTADGQERENLLLVSGWWGVARHFHYVAEITLTLAWTLPCGFSHFLPYFYVTFLTILLVHRSFRDDERCRAKYGRYWDIYCQMVPYRIIPRLF